MTIDKHNSYPRQAVIALARDCGRTDFSPSRWLISLKFKRLP